MLIFRYKFVDKDNPFKDQMKSKIFNGELKRQISSDKDLKLKYIKNTHRTIGTDEYMITVEMLCEDFDINSFGKTFGLDKDTEKWKEVYKKFEFECIIHYKNAGQEQYYLEKIYKDKFI